jgi:hypothetical protein
MSKAIESNDSFIFVAGVVPNHAGEHYRLLFLVQYVTKDLLLAKIISFPFLGARSHVLGRTATIIIKM